MGTNPQPEAGDHRCPRCGLPIGRAETGGPLWTPQMKGVEVCGCPPEESQLRAHADEVHRELDELEHELDDIKHNH